MLYRVQDTGGRGPFRPGFSHVWRHAYGESLPAFFEELGIAPERVRTLVPDGMYAGCSCRSDSELRRWFSRTEMRRLARLGFGVVVFEPDAILAETPTQVLFAMHLPLASLNAAVAA